MGYVVEIHSPYNTWWKRWKHYLFSCPTFWRLKPAYRCSICGKRYRCYWDLNDTDKGINICRNCI
jgi:hypothetical protein